MHMGRPQVALTSLLSGSSELLRALTGPNAGASADSDAKQRARPWVEMEPRAFFDVSHGEKSCERDYVRVIWDPF